MKGKLFVPALLTVVVSGALTASAGELVLEPFTYTQDFETRELSAWASYPLWQDTAYDPNFRVNELVPGDPNISIAQIVTPYTNVDNYAGAQKELDMYLVPGSTITLRYFLKTQLTPEFFKVRLAAGPDGKVDYTVPDPPANRWVWLTVGYDDFIRENPRLAGKTQIKVNALATLAKFPDADPAMPIYFGLDDIEFKGARAMAFKFTEPEMFKLSEWRPYIPANHYRRGETFTLRGYWPLDAKKVTLDVVVFTHPDEKVLSTSLKKKGGEWTFSTTLDYPEGLYLARLTAWRGDDMLSETPFTFYIAPPDIGGVHPRLWFDAEKKRWVDSRLKSERFKDVDEEIVSGAERSRKNLPLEDVVFDVDQFPKEDWIATLSAWSGGRIGAWRRAIHSNAMAYAFHDDREAGEYAKDVFVKISGFPYWLHPWMINRGRHIYYPLGEMGMDLALAYDLIYDLMDESERRICREAMMKNIVLGCHKGYVEDDLVTNNTSNWVAHITGGSLMCQAAMYGDGADVARLEPYFTGAIMKDYELIQNALDRDGAYGEGYGYYNFSMLSWSKSLPAVENVFKIDMSRKLDGSYKELIWAGNIEEKSTFYFGDSSGGLRPLTNWAWLLPKYKDPLLGWFYNYLKKGETFMDVLYETADVPQKDPFDENPVRLFRDVGTTVFKSGWGADDFIFVMRTGPFVNHQHLDQGTFWLSGGGSLFIEERHGSTYYNDPNYQPWYTQPVAHSTILINDNHQSQRVGDPLWHVDGFDDYAFVTHFLDGENASFVSGDIGRLYWGKVKSITRNVLYIKPDAVLMVDTIVPGEPDVDVTLLYQTYHLHDIHASEDRSTIVKDGNTLTIDHIYPEHVTVKSVETPHYLYTLQREKPLEEEGMLTVSSRTSGNPLVMANLLTTSPSGQEPSIDVDASIEDGYIFGSVDGAMFAINTRPGHIYEGQGVVTDALVGTGDAMQIFAAMFTTLSLDGSLVMESEKPITAEIEGGRIKYYCSSDTKVGIGSSLKPSRVTVNGADFTSFVFDEKRGAVDLTLPAGEGLVTIE